MDAVTLYINHEKYIGNKIFDLSDKQLNRDNCLFPFHALKTKMAEYGYDLSTQDINGIKDSKAVLYINLPPVDHIYENENNFLLFLESPLVRDDNYDRERHHIFKKVFTNWDSCIDGIKYVKVNYSYNIPNVLPDVPFQNKRLCCLIAANKATHGKKEILTERKKVIKWFDKNHPSEFDLFGSDWDKHVFPKTYIGRRLNKIPLLKNSFGKKYSFYNGRVERKSDTLSGYKFTLAFENVKNVPGYITEKVFDALFAGVVPVYYGADNISEYIPEGCFIDYRRFNSIDELYSYLSNMEEDRYACYIENIYKYLKSDTIYPYSHRYFAETIASNIQEII